MFDPDYLTGVFWFKNRARGTGGIGSMETFAVRESLRNGLGATISKTIGWELSPKHRNFRLAWIKMVPVPCSSAPRFIWFSSRWNRISPQTWFKWLIRRCQNAKGFASYCIILHHVPKQFLTHFLCSISLPLETILESLIFVLKKT